MRDNLIHKIAENSCFYQGHIGQFFAKKFNKFLSFRILNNRTDQNKLEEFNVEKYRSIFSRIINQKISLRKQDGGDFQLVSPDNIKIEAIRLIDNIDEEGACGWFEIYPPTALCTKDNCNHYFILTEGRKCGHKDTDPWEQFTFINFCDECGRLLPLHYMTNVNSCKKCGLKYNAVSSLIWTRSKDDISSYKVKCKKCGNIEHLFFLPCNHEDEKRSKCPPKKFKGIPTRANAIIHPLVISIADIPQDDEGKKTIQGRALSEAFNYFFEFEFEEAKLRLPEFKNALLKEENFWKLPKVIEIVEDIFDDPNKKLDRLQFNQHQFLKIIKQVLKIANIKIQDGEEKGKINEKFGIDFIKKSLNSVKEINFDEKDLEGLNLLCSTNIGKREKPNNFFSDYEIWRDEFGLKKVIHYPDINMVQSLLGTIEGSTRRNPVLFRPMETGKINAKKPTVFVRNFFTEGILFQLDCNKILNWLQENRNQVKPGINILPPEGIKTRTHYREVISKDNNCRKSVYTLLHTYSHMLMQQSTIDTGLDLQSISEIIYPNIASIFIYSTNSINIGGLEYTYDYHLEDWFSRVMELANDCPQDPACMVDEGGACNACSYVPEFVCCNYNQDIDRSTLVGGSDRFAKGYLA